MFPSYLCIQFEMGYSVYVYKNVSKKGLPIKIVKFCTTLYLYVYYRNIYDTDLSDFCMKIK